MPYLSKIDCLCLLLFIVLPRALVLSAVSPLHFAEVNSVFTLPISLIVVSVSPLHGALAGSNSICPLALITVAISPDHSARSCLVPVFVEASFIDGTASNDEFAVTETRSIFVGKLTFPETGVCNGQDA